MEATFHSSSICFRNGLTYLAAFLSFSSIILGINCPYSLRETKCLITNLDLKIHFPSSLNLPPSGVSFPCFTRIHKPTTNDQFVFFSSYSHGGVPWKYPISHRDLTTNYKQATSRHQTKYGLRRCGNEQPEQLSWGSSNLVLSLRLLVWEHTSSSHASPRGNRATP